VSWVETSALVCGGVLILAGLLWVLVHRMSTHRSALLREEARLRAEAWENLRRAVVAEIRTARGNHLYVSPWERIK